MLSHGDINDYIGTSPLNLKFINFCLLISIILSRDSWSFA